MLTIGQQHFNLEPCERGARRNHGDPAVRISIHSIQTQRPRKLVRRHETSTGGTGTTRMLEHEDLEIDGGSTTEGGGGHEGVGMHQGGDEGGRAKRQREGSSRRVKTKKPREDPEGGSPSAFDSMD